ncbi:MAG: hypothetical protein ACKO6L_01340, partial [Flavobacteriales bacterium]
REGQGNRKVIDGEVKMRCIHGTNITQFIVVKESMECHRRTVILYFWFVENSRDISITQPSDFIDSADMA